MFYYFLFDFITEIYDESSRLAGVEGLIFFYHQQLAIRNLIQICLSFLEWLVGMSENIFDISRTLWNLLILRKKNQKNFDYFRFFLQATWEPSFPFSLNDLQLPHTLFYDFGYHYRL